MTVINKFMGLALFIASVAGVGAAQRSLLVDDPDFVIQPENENGEPVTIKILGEDAEFDFPSGAIVEVKDGEVTYEPPPAATLPAARDRRLQTATCQSDETSCVSGGTAACLFLTTECAKQDFGSLSAEVCADLSFCSTAGVGESCQRSCAQTCDVSLPNPDSQCPDGEICCLFLGICEQELAAGGCGDPHMTGFRGQKFDFTGKDGQWYCMLEDGPSLHVNMRVTSPVPSLPEITYITGLSVITTDDEGIEHTIDISVTNPHSMDSICPVGVSPCLADGALTVKLDGVASLASPGEVTLGPSVAVSAVNLPGACRSFGYETYWERKKLENASAGRRLDAIGVMQEMGDWVLGDPTATNKLECTEYVAAAGATLGGLFAHNSEHASFQIVTPRASIRLSHGRLHQLPMRDPTDQFDLPEHLTWQMNVAIDQHDVSLDATGILGETVVPTVDDMGKPIMQGIHAIRGTQDDYRVAGPLEIEFAQGHHRE